VQVVDQITLLTKYQNVRFCGVYGGTNINTQKIAVNQGLDIIVATPGRLVEFFPDQMGVIHSNKSQNYRLKTLERFKNGEHRFIIATDVMARGLDVSDITHVISFDAPTEPETHIHRIGRTGRAENEGFAISIYSEAELDKLKKIEDFIQQKIKILTIPEEVEISNVLTEEELPTSNQKDYLRDVKLEKSEDEKGAAFHEKKLKNKKVNLGGPGRRKPKTGKKVNRGQQKRKFKKQK